MIPEGTSGVVTRIDADGTCVIRIKLDDTQVEFLEVAVRMEEIEDHFIFEP